MAKSKNASLQPHQFYGYEITQNPSNKKLTLYIGAVDAKILRDVVSVDNAVNWDTSSGVWKSDGRNRTIIDAHWQSIQEFLASSNLERIMPTPIVISVDADAFEFNAFPKMEPIANSRPGLITIKGRYTTDDDGDLVPVGEKERTAWVLDGQHRIRAFRNWTMPDPYPMNVVIIKAWKGSDYEDVMRHQTYELNMGRPLSEDFKAAIREQYDKQLGHREYKRQIGLSWIRRNVEQRGYVLGPEIVGAPNLRPSHVLTMSFVEKLIETAFESCNYLKNNFNLENLSKNEVEVVGKYLYDFFEGIRLSIGLLNPNTKGTIGTSPEVQKAKDYWDIAKTTRHKQRLVHNVGLKALVKGLLNKVMRSSSEPKSPEEVAKLLDHMRGIAWHDVNFQSKKDDWVIPLAKALEVMFESKGIKSKEKKYTLVLQKTAPNGNVIDTYNLNVFGW